MAASCATIAAILDSLSCLDKELLASKLAICKAIFGFTLASASSKSLNDEELIISPILSPDLICSSNNLIVESTKGLNC